MSLPYINIKIVRRQDPKTPFWALKVAQNAIFQKYWPTNLPKLIKTVYEQDYNIKQDTLMSLPCINIKIVRHQDPKTPFWAPRIVQNPIFQKYWPTNLPKLIKTVYEQDCNIKQDTLMSLPYINIKIVRRQDTKTPFWALKVAQNAIFQKYWPTNLPKLIKTVYEQDCNIKQDTLM